ncbi:MAG: sulfotransferase [Cyanobacteria bacterium P01_A01_bin.83]
MQTQETLRPIFVVGNSRSGTTLIGRILNCHPTVFTFEELHFFEELWNPDDNSTNLSSTEATYLFSQLLNIQRNGYLTQGKTKDFILEANRLTSNLSSLPSPLSIFAAFLDYETKNSEKTRPCEQTPQNTLYIGEILQAFPEARIIHMIRDPRDILLSQKQRWKRPFLADNIPKKEAIRYWLNYHPITISKLWQGNINSVEQFAQDSRVKDVRFEDLVSNPQQTVIEICKFLNLTYSDKLLAVPTIGSSNTRDDSAITGINQSKAQNWTNGGLKDVEIFWCQLFTQSLMEKYGYELKAVSPSPFNLALSLLSFPLKLALAIPFNLGRVRNLKAAISRRLT